MLPSTSPGVSTKSTAAKFFSLLVEISAIADGDRSKAHPSTKIIERLSGALSAKHSCSLTVFPSPSLVSIGIDMLRSHQAKLCLNM